MSIVSKYISKNVLICTLTIILIITVVDTLFSTMNRINDNLHILELILYLIYKIPILLNKFHVISCLVGISISAYIFSKNNENTVFRNSGLSINKIFLICIKPIILISFINLLSSEYITPKCHEQVDIIKKNNNKNNKIWLYLDNNFISINKITSKTEIHDVWIYKIKDNNKLISIKKANTLIYKNNKWHAKDIKQVLFNKDNFQYTEPKTLNINLDPELIEYKHKINYQQIRLSKLWKQNKLNNKVREVGKELFFWQQILQVFYIIIITYIALPFLMSSNRNKHFYTKFIITTISTIIIYFININISNGLILMNVNPFLSAISTLLILLIYIIIFSIFRIIHFALQSAK